MNVHFHALALDGVFAPGVDGSLRFHRLPAPTDADVARLVAALARRLGRVLARRGLAVDAEATDRLAAESLALAGLASAAVQGRLALGPRAGARVERLGGDPHAPWVESSRPLQARCDGCDLHAAVTVAGEDRRQLERLCRYLLRPPIAQDRLALRPDGTVVVSLKTPWRDGTTHLRFEPLTLLERLASLTPRPRINVLIYHGILAPHAARRAAAVSYGRPAVRDQEHNHRSGAGAAPRPSLWPPSVRLCRRSTRSRLLRFPVDRPLRRPAPGHGPQPRQTRRRATPHLRPCARRAGGGPTCSSGYFRWMRWPVRSAGAACACSRRSTICGSCAAS